MIREGLTEEGLEIVKAIRERFDGERRNPWNEFECGSNYARSMASFSLIPCLLGYSADLYRGKLSFLPAEDEVRGFFGNDGCWGEYTQDVGEIRLEIFGGSMKLNELEVLCGKTPGCFVNGAEKAYELKDGVICFADGADLTAGTVLTVKR